MRWYLLASVLTVATPALALAQTSSSAPVSWTVSPGHSQAGSNTCTLSGDLGAHQAMAIVADAAAPPMTFTLVVDDNAGQPDSQASTGQVAIASPGSPPLTIPGTIAFGQFQGVLDPLAFKPFLHIFTAEESMTVTLDDQPAISVNLSGTTNASEDMWKCEVTQGINQPVTAPTTTMAATAPASATPASIAPSPPDDAPTSLVPPAPAPPTEGPASLVPPAAIVAGAPPAQPPQVLSGAGNENTDPFTVNGPWTIKWRSTDPNPIIQVKQASDGSDVQTLGGTGNGRSYMPTGGTFYLDVDADGAWTFVIAPPGSPAAQPDAPAAAQTTASASTQSLEDQFIGIVQAAMASYKSASNDMASGGVRAARASSLCGLFAANKEADGWTGTITTLSSSNQGWGVLAVKLTGGITVETMNNGLSDAGDQSMIDPSSDLFKTVSQMHEGEPIKFSGTFFDSQADCVQEISLTQDGSMTSPDFVMKFTSIEALQ
jgi:hypothetical protein